jgi:hypothetical protein
MTLFLFARCLKEVTLTISTNPRRSAPSTHARFFTEPAACLRYSSKEELTWMGTHSSEVHARPS